MNREVCCSNTLASDCESPSWCKIWVSKVQCEEDFQSKTWFRFATANNALRKPYDNPPRMARCRKSDQVSSAAQTDPTVWRRVELWLTHSLLLSQASDYFLAEILMPTVPTNPKLEMKVATLIFIKKTTRRKKLFSSSHLYQCYVTLQRKKDNERNFCMFSGVEIEYIRYFQGQQLSFVIETHENRWKCHLTSSVYAAIDWSMIQFKVITNFL